MKKSDREIKAVYDAKVRKTEVESLALSGHPDVFRAYDYYKRGVFKGHGELAFWTNDNETDATGQTIRWGKKTAMDYCTTNGGAHVMGDFEGRDAFCGNKGVIELNAYDQRGDLDPMLRKFAVPVMASYSFAKSASGAVIASARGAYPDGFFRDTELPILMDKDDVTHIRIIYRVEPKDRLLPKHEAYHTLRDEWLESSYERCLEARDRYRKDPTIDKNKTDYNKTLNDLATEVLIADRSRSHPYPAYDAGGALSMTEGLHKESNRLRIGRSYMRDFPDIGELPSLEHKVENPLEWEEPSKQRAIIAAVEKRYAVASPALGVRVPATRNATVRVAAVLAAARVGVVAAPTAVPMAGASRPRAPGGRLSPLHQAGTRGGAGSRI